MTNQLIENYPATDCQWCGVDISKSCLNYLNGEGPLCTSCAAPRSDDMRTEEALERLRANVHTESDVLLLASAYDRLTDPAMVTEENLRAEGFEDSDGDSSIMWLLGVGQMECDVSIDLDHQTSLAIDSNVVRRGKVTIGDVRLLLKALGHKS